MVRRLPAMVSMELDQKETTEFEHPSPPKYPYGLCICLCQDELDKLNLDVNDVNIGDMIHLFCVAEVTSISRDERQGQAPSTRVQLQITNIAADDEDTENYSVTKKLYK